jgi:hypothetical protein
VVNGINQLSLMKGNWGDIGTAPVQCPSWAILSLDHMGRVKQPCCIGSADRNSLILITAVFVAMYAMGTFHQISP